jgi:hypothetical protein
MQIGKDYIDDFDSSRKLIPLSLSNDGKTANCKVYWKTEKGNAWNYGGRVSVSARMFDHTAGFILETTQIAKDIAFKANEKYKKEKEERRNNERKFEQR